MEIKTVDVIIPVYAGLDETRACIVSAMETIDPEVGELTVINDCSPEPELVKWLESASLEYGFRLLHNDINLGFVATVNRGMQLNLQRDVLLLNSDVEVSGDWLTRMREGAYQHQKVGSLTPFSNNATICSFPNFCRDNELLFGLDIKALDDLFAASFNSADLVPVPTGIGFCMYIRRDCLDAVGYFDVETFGKGYGEENDWCQRAEKAGWPNFHQANVFAYHKGGVSFDAESEPRKAKALELLAAKHPDYDHKVQTFIQQDPARDFRIAALWKLVAASSLPKVVQVTHRLGGGVQQHADELSRHYHGEAVFLQLMPFIDGESVTLSVCDNGHRLLDSLSFRIDDEYDQLLDLLVSLGVGRVHFHHTMGLNPRVWGLAHDLGCGYDFTVHDYYCVNGNPTLIDAAGRFAGELAVSEIDAACAQAYPIPVSAEQWRLNQRGIIEGAERVIFPSVDTQQRFSDYFEISNPVTSWHPDYLQAQPYPGVNFEAPADRPLRVLVLGALSREKGADVLEAVARQSSSCEFHLLGYAYRALNDAVIAHGPYESQRAAELIKEIAPDVIWFPALWPETYSYTLSLALELGLPVVVPNIGAFAERVQGRAGSWVVPWDQSTDQWVDLWQRLGSGDPLNIVAAAVVPAVIGSLYSAEYLSPVLANKGSPNSIKIESLAACYQFTAVALSPSEKVLRGVWRVSRLPIVRGLIGLIPFDLKRALKRRLSSRPMHEILNLNNPDSV